MAKPATTSDLGTLKNLGPTSVGWLCACGITSAAELRRVGAVMAYRIVRHRFPATNALLLFALHGALTDTHWNALHPATKARLRAEAAGDLVVGAG
ncbi:MAG: TfoX/Sxy family protein [Rhodothermales bacterium]